MIFYFLILIVFLLAPLPAYAHCPLCTIGAGAITLLAIKLGISSIIIGLFIGAFSVALGSWLGRSIKKQYIPYQRWILEIFFYLTIVLPLIRFSDEYTSLYISVTGDYGSPLNRVYLFNLFLIGSILGAIAVMASPFISKAITKKRQKTLPYQGLIVTFSTLAIISIILEIIINLK